MIQRNSLYLREQNADRPVKEPRIASIIHLFAVVHAGIVVLCHAFHVQDELLLTGATIALISILCFRKQQSLDAVAAWVIAGNVFGFIVGTYGARLLRPVIENGTVVHVVTTMLTTEIIGFGVLFLLRFFRHPSEQPNEKTGAPIAAIRHRGPGIGQILLLLGIIMLLRIGYSRLFSHYFTEALFRHFFRALFGNSLALLTLICCNIIYIRISRRWAWYDRPLLHITGVVFESGLLAAVTALLIGYDLPFGTPTPFAEGAFLQTGALLFLVNIVIYLIVLAADYIWLTRTQLHRERDKRHMAQFRYSRLKQQVNPHFLFNSLNILNGLVEENKNPEAGEYIRKLASLYRYMLQNEQESLVRLNDELTFTQQYVDLLKVRFPDGFRIESRIDPQARNSGIVPCSLQMLIENALKHNTVRAESPLHIVIEAVPTQLTVTNNLQPRYAGNDPHSTHLGLTNIAQQYRDILGKAIAVRKTTTEFRVELPLIRTAP